MAAFPIILLSIQDVQLFNYAVAHKTINSSYGLQANNDQMVADAGSDWSATKSLQNAETETNWISALTKVNKDPDTSDQQRSRDQYTIDDHNWNEVTFEQVIGSSKCKLALHNDYNRLVSDEGRKSSDTKSLDSAGTATNRIAASSKANLYDNSTTVYNIEVWREHNYYVGSKESGEFMLVHNSCWDVVEDFIKKYPILKTIGIDRRFPGRGLNFDQSIAKVKQICDKFGKLAICYDDLGFPDFSGFLPLIDGKPEYVEVPDLDG